MTHVPELPDDVARVLRAAPAFAQPALLQLRSMIYEVAQETEGVGRISETLKWGQPSYEAVAPKSGTPLRIGIAKTGNVALFAHCQSRVIPEARDIFSQELDFEGNRAVLLPVDRPLPDAPLRRIIHSALTYRLAARSSRRARVDHG